MSLSNKNRCLQTLIAYRKYVSDHDVALHHRWKATMQGLYLVPQYWDDTNARECAKGNRMLSVENRLWAMFSHASVFRQILYYDLYNSCEHSIMNFKRGECFCWAEYCYTYLMTTPETFFLNISLKRHTDLGVF